MSSCQQLTLVRRYQIRALLNAGLSQTQIADNVGVYKSAVSRELSRNRGLRTYKPRQAHCKAMARRIEAASTKFSDQDWGLVQTKIRDRLVPRANIWQVQTLRHPEYFGSVDL